MGTLDLSQDTVRQRRNLLITSILLIFISLAEVSFSNEVTFLGAKLYIGKPEAIHFGLLISLAYFLWRFYQYFSTDKAYSELRSQFGDYLKRHTSLKIVKEICKQRGLSGLMGEYLYSNLQRSGFFTYTIEAIESQEYDPNSSDVVQTKFTAELSVIRLEVFRLIAIVGFAFRARILTDYYVPYLLVIYTLYLELNWSLPL